MDVPSSVAGTVVEVLVQQGQPRVQGHAAGAPRRRRDADSRSGSPARRRACAAPAAARACGSADARSGACSGTCASPLGRRRQRRQHVPADASRSTQLLVLGAGPGGYTAAFRAADLGLQGHADRALGSARRRVPECRLHSVQGAAACGEGHRRSARDERARHRVRRAASWTSTSCAPGRAASSRS